MNRSFFLLLIIFFVFSRAIFSQEFENKELAITSYKFSGGLYDDNIRHIIQDSLGYIWVGTRNELFKFDGNSTYSIPLFGKKGPVMDIDHLFRDNKGDIWIITSRGIKIFEYSTQQVIDPPAGFENYSISCFFQGDGDNIWFSTDTGELLYYNRSDQSLIDYPSAYKVPIKALVPFPDNKLIVNFENSRISIFDMGNRTFGPDLDTDILEDSPIYNGKKFKNDKIVLASRQKLFQLDRDRKLTELKIIKAPNSNGQPLFITDLLEVNDSIIWVATDGNGLLGYNQNSRATQRLNLKGQFPIYAINSLFKDRNGAIWIGTINSGIQVFDPFQSKFTHWEYEKGNLTGLSSNSALCLSETADGKILVGLDGGGINSYDPKTNLFEHYLHPQNGKNVINSILSDRKNTIWVGTYVNGLTRLWDNGRDINLRDYLRASYSQSHETIKSLFVDKGGKVWAGSSNGIYLHGPDGNLIRQISETNDEDPKNLGLVMSVVQTADSAIWIATNNLLARYDPSDDKVRTVHFDDAPHIVTSIIEAYNHLWIGTKSGLFRMDIGNGEVKQFTVEDGLSCTVVNGLLNDDLGHIWISTTRGLFQYDPENNEFRNFGYNNGFKGQFNENAVLKGNDGKLYFGSTNGVYSFYPDQIKKNINIPPVVISRISTFNRNKSDLDSITTVVSRNLINHTAIELDHDQNVFTIDFVALNFTLADNNEYSYILHGFDEFWNHVGNQRQATYTNIPPGEYEFQVKAANNDGIWNNIGQNLSITIFPPWYKTNWAIALWILLTVLFIFFLNRYLWKQIKLKEMLRLERLDKLRQEASNESKIQFFTNITHELRTPLTLILGPMDKLISSTREGSPQRKQLQLIKKNTNRLLNLINQILDFRKLELGENHINISRINLVLFMNEICDSFKEMAGEKSISVHYTPHVDNLEIWSDSGTIEKIMFNLLANAIKFSSEGDEVEVEIDMDNQTGEALIQVIDMGKGIPEEELPHIFKRFYQVKDNTNTGTGIGLALTYEMVEMIKGSIQVSSKLGSGSTFSIRLPLGNDHFEIAEQKTVDSYLEREYDPGDEVIVQEVKPYLNDLGSERETNRYSVLVIEDEKDLREYVIDILKDFFQVWEASNGEDGYKMAVDLNPNLIISDILMPKLSGLELCHQLKSNFSTSHIPIILLTALTSNNQKIEGLEKGADDYITKPFNSELLLHKVHNLIKNRIKLMERFKTEIAMEPEAITSTSADERFLKEVIAIIKVNISDSNFKVDHIINEIGMSRSPFYKKLKNLSGLSPNEFIRMVRMKHAVQLLTKTDKNISEIAYDVGFSSPKYFRECFKDQFGQTPSEFGKDPKLTL